jgi:hypothetical protein
VGGQSAPEVELVTHDQTGADAAGGGGRQGVGWFQRAVGGFGTRQQGLQFGIGGVARHPIGQRGKAGVVQGHRRIVPHRAGAGR